MNSRSRDARRREVPERIAVPGFLGLAFGSILALHFLEPEAGITWSYAHLARSAWLPITGAALVVALPIAVGRAWSSGFAAASLVPISRAVGISLALGLFAFLLVLGWLLPAPSTSMDAGLFLGWVEHGGDVARWHLLLKAHQLAVRAASDFAEPVTVVRAMNAGMATAALVALVATARLLGGNRGEAFALAALSLSALGVIQLCLGYADVYPLPLAVTALYVLASLRAIDGRLHPFWPLLLVALGPFVYLGLVLLAPSLFVVVARSLRAPGGIAKLAIGGAVATFLGGAATLPRFGSFFAWGAFVDAINELPATSMGFDKDGYNLPLEQVLSLDRLEEVFHLLLLIDPVGWVLLVGTGAFAISQLRSSEGARLAFLALLVAPYLAFVVAMDPLYGAYGDWDLFSYGAAATSVAGGFAFVLWGRAYPRFFPLLLGLALACAAVHLLARLDALDVDAERHLRESPSHIRHGPGRPNQVRSGSRGEREPAGEAAVDQHQVRGVAASGQVSEADGAAEVEDGRKRLENRVLAE